MFARGLVVVLVCDLAGEAIARACRVPIPGSVLGMALLLAALIVRGAPVPAALGSAGDRLVGALPFLFVPVGVVGCGDAALLRGSGVAVGAALAASIVVGLGVTVGVASLAVRRGTRRTERACAT
jgi:holin-like protein